MTISDLVTNPEFMLVHVPSDDSDKMKLVRPAVDWRTRLRLKKASEYLHPECLPHYTLSHLWSIPNEQKKQHMWYEIGDYVVDEDDNPVAAIPMRTEKRQPLLALLRAHPDSYWWIDVLCVRPRTPLVIMGDVYKYCQRCYAMIDCPQHVLGCLSDEVLHQMLEDFDHSMDSAVSKCKAVSLNTFVEEWSKQLQCMYQLTHCEWLKRVWTWQEATLPRFTYLICEADDTACMDQLVSMQQLTSLALKIKLDDPDITRELHEETVNMLRKISAVLKEIQAPVGSVLHIQTSKSLSPYAFTEAVASFGSSSRKCMDPVDYVYGVLGMLELNIPRMDDHQKIWKYFLEELEDYIQYLLENGDYCEDAPQVASVSISQKSRSVDLSMAQNMTEVYGGLLNVTNEDNPATRESCNEPNISTNILEVGNLPSFTTSFILYKRFRQFGRMALCKVITDQSRWKGTAFIQYLRAIDETMAIRCMDNEKYNGNIITVSPSSESQRQYVSQWWKPTVYNIPAGSQDHSGTSRSARTATSVQDIDCNNLYITNLDLTMQKSDLFAHFCQYGRLKSVQLIQEEETKESEGYGIVRLSTAREAVRALKAMNKTYIKGKLIAVSLVNPKRSAAPTDLQFAHTPSSVLEDVGNSSGNSSNSMETARSASSSEKAQLDPTKLYIKNLDPSVQKFDLFHHFHHYGCVISVKVVQNSHAQAEESRGYGFVSFTTAEQARRALQATDRTYIKGMQISVEFCEPRQPRIIPLQSTNNNNAVMQSQSPLAPPAAATVQQQQPQIMQATSMTMPVSGYEQQPQTSPVCSVSSLHEDIESNSTSTSSTISIITSSTISISTRTSTRTSSDSNNNSGSSSDVNGHTEMSRSDPMGTSQSASSSENAQIDYTNLYIKNLAPSVRNSDLFHHFRRYGWILSIKVIQNAQAKGSSGYGFVSFKTAEQAHRALKATHRTYIKDVPIFVNFHEPKKSRTASPSSTNNNNAAMQSQLSPTPPQAASPSSRVQQDSAVSPTPQPMTMRSGAAKSRVNTSSSAGQDKRLLFLLAVTQCGEQREMDVIVDMLLTLTRKEQALCLFNRNYLHEKIAAARLALEACVDAEQ